MNKAARTPPRLHPAIPIAAILLCLGFLIWFFFPIIKLGGQWFAVLALLLAFRYWPPFFDWLRSMPLPHRIVFGAIVGTMILGHLTIRPRTYFPFIPWCIFPTVREEDPVVCRQFYATTVSGHKVRLLVEQLFPSIVQFNPPDDYNSAAMNHMVQAMAKVYNQHHPDDVQHVDLVQMAVRLHPPGSNSQLQPSCELLKRYDISSAR